LLLPHVDISLLSTYVALVGGYSFEEYSNRSNNSKCSALALLPRAFAPNLCFKLCNFCWSYAWYW